MSEKVKVIPAEELKVERGASKLVEDLDREIAEDQANAYRTTPPQEQEEVAPQEPEELQETQEEAQEEDVIPQEAAPEPEPPVDEEEQETEEPQKKKRISWKQRYTSYKLATDATIHSLRVEIAGVKEELGRYAEALNTASIQLKEAQANQAAGKADLDATTILSEEEQEYLGKEGISALGKLVKAHTKSQVTPLQERLQQQDQAQAVNLQRDAQQASQNAFQSFLGQLGAVVPNYSEIAAHPKFSEWGKQLDPFSGRPIQQDFQAAEQRGDVRAVANYLLEFEQLVKTNPQRRLEENQSTTGEGGSTAAATVAQEQQRKAQANAPLSIKKIEAFYNDVAKGRYAGQMDVVRETEALIDQATRENRIVP